MRRFWNWNDDELRLEGIIAEDSWCDDDIAPREFRKELMNHKGPVTVYINSPGGDTIAASEIYSMLREFPHAVTIKVTGLAASAASVIAMAGTEVQMSPTALLMIHNPATMAFGDHKEMEKAIDVLSAVKEGIVSAYSDKSGLPREQISQMMEEETWLDAHRAVELGFADKIMGDDHSDGMQFSQKKVDRALVNRMSGIPVQPLYDRLDQLR